MADDVFEKLKEKYILTISGVQFFRPSEDDEAYIHYEKVIDDLRKNHSYLLEILGENECISGQ